MLDVFAKYGLEYDPPPIVADRVVVQGPQAGLQIRGEGGAAQVVAQLHGGGRLVGMPAARTPGADGVEFHLAQVQGHAGGHGDASVHAPRLQATCAALALYSSIWWKLR